MAAAVGGAGTGGEPCVPVAELCNGADDDCDGAIDEGDPEGGEACNTGIPGACAAGLTACMPDGLSCVPNMGPTVETCDGVDNDCDGPVDEELGCERRVFVTSQVFTGDLGGLTGADAKCQTLADAAGLGGTYMAWLSDLTGDPQTRMSHDGLPYVLADGVTVVASDWAQLTSGGLQHAIDTTELLGPAPIGSAQCDDIFPSPTVWTNTQWDGTLFDVGETCNSWSGGVGPSAWGHADLSGLSWTLHCNGGGVPVLSCANTAALYCFEQ
jgi:hypothetical protein